MSGYEKLVSSLGDRWSALWKKFMRKEREMPSRVTIPADHVRGKDFSPDELLDDFHYFMVQINEMYMSYQSKLWVALDPTVFVTTEFNYAKKKVTVPFIVGPDMIRNVNQPIPNGMIFSNTKVAGLHPYKGGDLSLSVILCQVARDSAAKKVLKLAEAAANALDYSTTLGAYLKVANVVMGGIEELMGIQGVNPIIGYRVEFHPEVSHDLRQSYFALINKPEEALNTNELWVIDDKLYKGKSFEDAKEYRDADYVLYSIRGTEKRDVDGLPFDEVWERVQKEAMQPDDNSWQRATVDFVSLFQTMYLSPDLTKKQALLLKKQYWDEIIDLHKDSKLPLVGATLLPRSKKRRKITEEEKRELMDKNLQESTKILDLQ